VPLPKHALQRLKAAFLLAGGVALFIVAAGRDTLNKIV
jgi:hypothetical protein